MIELWGRKRPVSGPMRPHNLYFTECSTACRTSAATRAG